MNIKESREEGCLRQQQVHCGDWELAQSWYQDGKMSYREWARTPVAGCAETAAAGWAESVTDGKDILLWQWVGSNGTWNWDAQDGQFMAESSATK